VFTLFFGKNRPKEDKEKQPMKKKECKRQIEGRKEGPTRFANGQRDPTLTVGQLVKVISRWSAGKSADEEKKRR
jgi:hypothetical protein